MVRKKLQGTKTFNNIMAAFSGESMARNKYDLWAEIARREGYEQIADLFEETAANEKAHARRLLSLIGLDEGTAAYLAQAADGERYEHTQMYPEFERIAKEEGFDDVAEGFREIAEVEEYHEERFLALKANIEQGKVVKRDEVVEWKCRNCGYIHKGTEPPKNCPACGYPQNYYELRAKNW